MAVRVVRVRFRTREHASEHETAGGRERASTRVRDGSGRTRARTAGGRTRASTRENARTRERARESAREFACIFVYISVPFSTHPRTVTREGTPKTAAKAATAPKLLITQGLGVQLSGCKRLHCSLRRNGCFHVENRARVVQFRRFCELPARSCGQHGDSYNN